MMKTKIFAKENWLLPFSASGFYVSDAKNRTVCECNSVEIAKEIAKILNGESK